VPHHPRLANLAGALVCAGLLAYALYAEFALHLEPCPLCIFQRITVLALGVCFVLAAAHGPRGWGGYVYAVLIGLAALATIGVAARHLYVQSAPPGSIPACGAPINTLLQMFPVTEVIRKVLHAGGECAVVNWRFLGLAMPAWVMLWAAVLGTWGVLTNALHAARVAAAPRSSGSLTA
jgi:protein dithiol:quinone oxidoreductase